MLNLVNSQKILFTHLSMYITILNLAIAFCGPWLRFSSIQISKNLSHGPQNAMTKLNIVMYMLRCAKKYLFTILSVYVTNFELSYSLVDMNL